MSPSHPLAHLLLSAALAAGGAVSLAAHSTTSSPALGTTAPTTTTTTPSPPPTAAVQARSAAVPAADAAGLTCTTSLRGTPVCVHGDDAPHPQHVAGTDSGASSTSGGALGCYGDGTSGPRVRAVYVRPQGSADRYAESLPSFRRLAAAVSGQFDASARATGGRRHVRFATTSGSRCELVVAHVVLPPAAFGSFQATIDALQARGLDAPHSKYLVWADATGVCGMATTYADDRPGQDNANNGALPGYARVDRRCWGRVEAHELVHMLGGVQTSAPHSTGGYHCNDGRDVMCYADGTARSTQTRVCGDERAALLDCRADDYFSTAPARGSYLATHWNTASSAFLAPALTGGTTAPPAPSSSRAPSPSASPAPTAAPRPVLVVPSLPPLPPLPVVTPLLPLVGQVLR